MADNMCGPSTALKSFSEHVNRDYSLHHERAGPSRAQPANFRSAPAATRSNEAEVRAFTSQAAFPAELTGVMPDVHGHVPAAPFQQIRPQIRDPRARLAGPGGISDHASNNWAAEFTAHPGAMHATTSAAVPQVRPAFGQSQPLQTVNQRLQHFSSEMMAPDPAFVSMYQSSLASHTAHSGYAPLTSSYIPPPFAATAVNPLQGLSLDSSHGNSGVAGLTEAELEARFAQMEAELDFQDEMDSWMQTHGPRASEQAEAAQAENVDDVLESLADELDAQRLDRPPPAAAEPAEEVIRQEAEQRDQDDLARTAGQIIDTLDAHPNTHFQESSFMRLMRRIHTREVTVKGDNLVDEATGLPIDGAEEGKMAEPTTTVPTSGGTP
ncbi:hypothetical protein SEPCBS119000_000038 [Sporothrix epigloea]|uniref:Peroxin 20 n=1 Tax=Sporothrix epigloea TaxID=1892477 RepID=A0ABP0D303_9PEZI